MAAPWLVFWVSCGIGACVPAIPSVGSVPPGARDASSEGPAFGGSPLADAPGRDAVPAPGSTIPPVDAAEAPEARLEGHADAAESRAAADVPDAGATVDAPDGGAAMDASVGRLPRALEIRIDEVLVDPAGNDLGHEWLELANVAAEALDLGGLHLSDGTTDVAIDGGVLAAGARLVLGQSADRAHNGDAPVALAYGTRLVLNNDADRVAVCLGPCAGGGALDAFAWTTPFGDAYVGHAVVVEPDGTICPAAAPYGSGGNFGTPGEVNPPCPAARPESPADAGARDAADGEARDGAAEVRDAGRSF